MAELGILVNLKNIVPLWEIFPIFISESLLACIIFVDHTIAYILIQVIFPLILTLFFVFIKEKLLLFVLTLHKVLAINFHHFGAGEI